jgi:uncharacterized protein YciI
MDKIISQFKDQQKFLIGASTFPEEEGVWYLKGITQEEAKSIVEDEPFYKEGLVDAWEISEWEQFGRTSVDGLTSSFEYSCL